MCSWQRETRCCPHTSTPTVCVLATTTGFTSKKYQYHKSKATRSLKGGLVQTWSQHPAPRPPPPACHQARSLDLCIWTVLPSWVWTMTSLRKYVTPLHSERWIRSNRTFCAASLTRRSAVTQEDVPPPPRCTTDQNYRTQSI